MVKRKAPQDPKFQQQQQPAPVPSGQQGGGSSAQNQGPQEQRPHGKRSGKQTKKKQVQQQLQFAQAAYQPLVHHTSDSPTTSFAVPNPCSLANCPVQIYQECQGPPTSDQTVCAFKHAHNFGIQLILETIQAINHFLPLLDRIDFSARISPIPSTCSSPAISPMSSFGLALPSTPASPEPVLATQLSHCHTMSAFQDHYPMSPSPSPPLAWPSYMAPLINTNQLVTVPETEYVCPIGDDDSDSEPPGQCL